MSGSRLVELMCRSEPTGKISLFGCAMTTVLLGFLMGASPAWTAKFVPNFRGMTHLRVIDCSRDLSLVGYGYSLMIDAVPCTPIAIIKGHKAEVEGSSKSRFWGFQITKSGYNAAVAEYQQFDEGDQRAKWNPKIVTVAYPGLRVLPSRAPKPTNSGFESGLYPAKIEYFSTLPKSLEPELKRRNQTLYEPGISVRWIGPNSSVRIGNANYQPVNPGSPYMKLYDSDVTIAVVKSQGIVRPLSSFVLNANNMSFDDIVWRSSYGWLVCRGSRGKESGLIWLYPYRNGI